MVVVFCLFVVVVVVVVVVALKTIIVPLGRNLFYIIFVRFCFLFFNL